MYFISFQYFHRSLPSFWRAVSARAECSGIVALIVATVAQADPTSLAMLREGNGFACIVSFVRLVFESDSAELAALPYNRHYILGAILDWVAQAETYFVKCCRGMKYRGKLVYSATKREGLGQCKDYAVHVARALGYGRNILGPGRTVNSYRLRFAPPIRNRGMMLYAADTMLYRATTINCVGPSIGSSPKE